MAELAADSGCCDLRGPVNDQRISHAAAVSILFVPLERRVARLRPSPGKIGVAIGAADVVEARDCGVEILAHAVEVAHLVEHADRAAFLAGAVVGHQDEERVVEEVELLEKVYEAADLRVGMVEHRGEGLLEPRGEDAFLVG
jgi:hypothetical protein